MEAPDAYVVILTLPFWPWWPPGLCPRGNMLSTSILGRRRSRLIRNSFSLVARQPVMPWQFLPLLPLGLEKAAEVVFLVLLVGGFLQIINDSGAIEAGLSYLIGALGKRRMLILPI